MIHLSSLMILNVTEKGWELEKQHCLPSVVRVEEAANCSCLTHGGASGDPGLCSHGVAAQCAFAAQGIDRQLQKDYQVFLMIQL